MSTKADLPNANAIGTGNLTGEQAEYNYLFSLVPRSTSGPYTFNSSSSGVAYSTETWNSGQFQNQGQNGMLSILQTVLANSLITAADFNNKVDKTGDIMIGNLTAPQFISNVAQGTAPFQVTSTTTVGNFSADMVDNIQGNNIAQLNAANTFTQNQTVPVLISSGLTGATAVSRYVGATTSGAPTTGTFAVGDFIIDQTGRIWVCSSAGSPGTWTMSGLSKQIFTTVGTSTFTAPMTGWYKAIVTGGGGSGAGGVVNSSNGSGAGGGTAIKWVYLTAGQQVTVTVGAGGASSGASNTAGHAGGTSSFGTYCSATGGQGGVIVTSSSTPWVSGGIGSNGDINLSGGLGMFPYWNNIQTLNGSGPTGDTYWGYGTYGSGSISIYGAVASNAASNGIVVVEWVA